MSEGQAGQPLLASAAPSLSTGRYAGRALSLSANVFWSIIGNAGFALSQWGVLVAIAKTGDVVAVGHFALALAVTAPLFIAASMQLRSVQATDVRQNYPFGEFLGQRICAIAVALIVVVPIALQYELKVGTAILLMGAVKAVECVSDIVCGVFQSRERMDLVTRSMLLRGWASLVAVAVCLPFTGELSVWIAALLLTRTLVLVGYDLPRCSRFVSSLKPRFDAQRIVKLTKVAAPLGFVALITSINVNIPRYEIERTLSAADLGIFSALSYILVLAVTITSAIGQAATPKLAGALAAGDTRRFAILSGKLALLVAAAGLALVVMAFLTGPRLIMLLYGPLFAAHANVFTLLAVATAVSLPASIVGHCTIATQAFAVQVPVAIATTLVTCVASAWLIPMKGLPGGALVLIVTATVQLGLAAAVLIRVLKRKPSQATVQIS